MFPNEVSQHPKVIVCLVFPPQGREGEIRHLFRGFAFLHCKKLVENGGMFVCKTRHLVLAGGSKVSETQPRAVREREREREGGAGMSP